MQHPILKEVLTYQDVLLVPQYSNIESRNEVDLGSDLQDGFRLSIPIIASPMDTVSESKMASAMHSNGGLAIIHRYNTIDAQCKHIEALPADAIVGAAVGMGGDFRERTEQLVLAGAQVICVDVAHGHHNQMREALSWLKQNCSPSTHIMAGNIATLDGFNALADWGADSVRCNIGGGSICTTRVQTGHGVPGLHTIFDCATSENTGFVKIIADGGIKNSGDIVKALAAGADFVMVGSLLSGTEQSPGAIVQTQGGSFKHYRGMASRAAQVDWRGRVGTPEGVSTKVPYKGDVNDVLEELIGGVRSGLSYSGARNIEELQRKAQFVRQTSAGQIESSAHIVNGYRS